MTGSLRSLPPVDALLRDPRLAPWPRPRALARIRLVLEALRERSRAGEPIDSVDVVALVVEALATKARLSLVPVINATGVILHTNLGRAPWSPRARAAAQAASGYTNVELDLGTGLRGGRLAGITGLLGDLVGAEDALVVNNGAAAVLLALTAFGAGREVVVSRGELVEIGGSFRVPDVITAGGARLCEVGTTNRTRPGDYAGAIGDATALLLKVHRSNFRVVGFTEEVSVAELVAVGAPREVPVFVDQGTGNLSDPRLGMSVSEALGAGADLVMFSGDKLLGGPQAGIIVGKATFVAQLRRHPLYRALRVDKTIAAALEATLVDWWLGEVPPVAAILVASPGALQGAAEHLARLLADRGVTCEVVVADGVAGGGALPEQPLPGAAVKVGVAHPDRVHRRLRTGAQPVVARLADGALWLDPRTVAAGELDSLADSVAAALRAE